MRAAESYVVSKEFAALTVIVDVVDVRGATCHTPSMENTFSNPLEHHDHGHREELQQVQRVRAMTRDRSAVAAAVKAKPALVHTPPKLHKQRSKANLSTVEGHVHGMVTVNGKRAVFGLHVSGEVM